MPNDPPHQGIEPAVESPFAPRHAWIGIEPACQCEKRDDEAHRHEHRHGADRRHDAEVVHRTHVARGQRTKPDHVGGNGTGHRPEERGEGRLQGSGCRHAQGAEPPELHDHVGDGADPDDRDHR